MNKILIIDLNNILFRFVEINKSLSYKGKRTGMLFGFLQTFCKYINEHQPDVVLVCGDKQPYKRKNIFNEYKNKPHSNDVDKALYIGNNRLYVTDVLSMMNIDVWKEDGYEADDLEACIIHKYNKEQIVICSNDDDLYSLLNKNVVLQRNKSLYTEEDFWKDYPELKKFKTPVIWERIKAMSGNHNGVKNIYRGLGDKTAINIITDDKKLEDFMCKYEKEFKFNLSLTKLPFDWQPLENIPELNYNNKFSLRRLENCLMKDYGINITSAMSEAFQRLGGR